MTLADLFVWTKKYILLDEVMWMVGGNKERKKKIREMKSDKGISWRHKKAKKPDGSSELQFDHYTWLIEPWFVILAAIEGSGLITAPKKADWLMGKNMDTDCRYYGTHGHFTNQYCELNNQFEALIKEGTLRRYVRAEERE